MSATADPDTGSLPDDQPDDQPGDQRDDSRARILRAARLVLAERGLSTTVDDVAARADVSRRTVFRHFDTRERLLAEAFDAGVRSYAQQIPADGPATDADADAWLTRMLLAVHRLNSGNGRVYWELAGSEQDLTGELAVVAAGRRKRRKQFATWVASTMWSAGGGAGRPPTWLVDAFALHLSAFTTAALSVDFSRSAEDVASMSGRVLRAALAGALAEQDGSPADR
jgi:AcrR family transcriptional regulator